MQVTFLSSVRWLSLEFDGRCGTAQSDDTLQLYIPTVATTTGSTTAAGSDAGPESAGAGDVMDTAGAAWCPVLSKFHGTDGWPTSAVVLPGK